MNTGNSVDVIYLDFAKAFDTVPHQRLLEKLKAHGIGGKLWNWIKSWLSGKLQRVCIKGKASDWTRVSVELRVGPGASAFSHLYK